jgi:hypothetical protein
VDIGSVAVIALIAGLAGGAVGAALVGTIEGTLRQRQVPRGSVTYPGRWAAKTNVYTGTTLGQPQPAIAINRLDTESRKVMTLARQEAIQSGHSHIGTEHLAMAFRLHKTPALDRIWSQVDIDPEALRRRIEVAVPPTLGGSMPTSLHTTPRVGTILKMANALADNRNRELVPPEIFLLAMVDEGDGVGAQMLASLGATAQRIREIVDGPTP